MEVLEEGMMVEVEVVVVVGDPRKIHGLAVQMIQKERV